MGEENKKKEKMSYDELKTIAGQLQQQNTFLREQLMKSKSEELYKRIDYLFKVVENKDMFSDGFVGSVVTEITDILTIPEQEDKAAE